MAKSLFEWDASKYALDIPNMDAEHQTLIGIMNKLHEKYVAKKPYAEVQSTVKELGDYVVRHFRDEEAYFDKLQNYSQKEVHKKIHQELLNKYSNHVKKFEEDKQLNEDFFLFLKVWLTAHIAGIDMKYSQAAHGKAA